MIGIDIEFYDIEFLDGYFSGTLFLFDRDQRIILDFGYDVEFKILTLQNCKKTVYNSLFEYYTSEEIADFRREYDAHIKLRRGWDLFIRRLFLNLIVLDGIPSPFSIFPEDQCACSYSTMASTFLPERSLYS